ncbi:D-alanyl-lipoteichoic acid acyltransferase DltB, MBOAT superfamily [Lachnospiraceae bacterium XBB2008]|nr:D-alanyl-lipoteichoic acid acyltransferase DltB, MBOAT superfamily [Lachnospiraceae bacterium XBB2008]
MNLTDFYFLCAFAIILAVYYLVPRAFQWGVLLVSSIAFYLVNGYPFLVLFPIVSTLVVYLCAGRIASCDAQTQSRSRRTAVTVGVIALLAILILLKYTKFIWVKVSAYPEFMEAFLSSLIPLGLSYYTFTLISYLVDVYNGIVVPEKNYLKLLTFGMYGPALVSGPIMQYREVGAGFFEAHSFSYESLTRGLQRMLWGFFKKLVIAERLSIVVAVVFDNPAGFGGIYVWGAIICFTIQLYADFSGLMDIVLGISQCFGLKLPENFDTPFFSKTIAELWRRWHMTLGTWCKEYIFYPQLRTGVHSKLTGRLEKMFGVDKPTNDPDSPDSKAAVKKAKKKAKRFSTFAAMFVLWLIIGLWHGGSMTFVIGSGLLQWFYIVMEELLEEPFKKLWKSMKVDPDSKVLNVLRMIRTFLLFAFGMAFFRSPSVSYAIGMLGCGVRRHSAEVVGLFRGFTGAFSADGLRALKATSSFGLAYVDIFVLVFSLLILMLVDIAKTRTDVRAYIAARPIVLRFIVWFALLFYVIILGQYGPGYSAAEFIYQGF